MFKINEEITPKKDLMLKIIGSIIINLLWTIVVEFNIIPKSILPSPIDILKSFPKLLFDNIIENWFYSVKLNIIGLLEAIALALPIGFIIGLFPTLNSVFEKYISSLRFLPLTALTGLFIIWFGIEDIMKIQFLAFAIFLYLLPCVIEKVRSVDDIYIQTSKTCGCNNIQLVFKVYVPLVISRVFDDIRNLSALSWTYVVVAELVNAGAGGLGAASYLYARQSMIASVFAVLIIIVLTGILQDYILKLMDKMFFSYKYATKGVK